MSITGFACFAYPMLKIEIALTLFWNWNDGGTVEYNDAIHLKQRAVIHGEHFWAVSHQHFICH